jgi:hypothetical protein
MKNKKQDEKIPLRVITTMRVISEPVEAALKAVRELLNERPELVPLIEDMVKIVAREENLDFLSQSQDNLPLRVAVLEQHVKDLQKEAEQRRKSPTQQQEKQADENEVIADRFSTLWTGKSQGRRLLPEGIVLMHILFAKGMTDDQIGRLSGMKPAAVKRRREEWEGLRATKVQSVPRKNHDHCQPTMTATDSEVTSNHPAVVEERPKRASRSDGKGQVPQTEAEQCQRNEGKILDSRVAPSSSLRQGKLKSGSQNPIARRSEKVDPREPRSGLTSVQRTELANMFIEWTFRREQNGLTKKLISQHFGISVTALKVTYLSVLKKAGLLDKDRHITHEEILDAYASKLNRLS